MTVQGPVKKQQRNGMSHRGGGGGCWQVCTQRLGGGGITPTPFHRQVRPTAAVRHQLRLRPFPQQASSVLPFGEVRGAVADASMGPSSSHPKPCRADRGVEVKRRVQHSFGGRWRGAVQAYLTPPKKAGGWGWKNGPPQPKACSVPENSPTSSGLIGLVLEHRFSPRSAPPSDQRVRGRGGGGF